MLLASDRKAVHGGRASPTEWALFAGFVLVVGLIVWAATRTPKEDFVGSIPVYTDAVIGEDSPPECLDFAGRSVTIRDEAGELLWSGTTGYEFRELRIPDLGCEVMFYTDPIPVSQRYELTIEGLGTRTYKFSVLEKNYNIFVWDRICLDAPDPEEASPCRFDEPLYE